MFQGRSHAFDSEGAQSPGILKIGGPKYTFTLVWPKKWAGPGPPGPLGDYAPVTITDFSQ